MTNVIKRALAGLAGKIILSVVVATTLICTTSAKDIAKRKLQGYTEDFEQAKKQAKREKKYILLVPGDFVQERKHPIITPGMTQQQKTELEWDCMVPYLFAWKEGNKYKAVDFSKTLGKWYVPVFVDTSRDFSTMPDVTRKFAPELVRKYNMKTDGSVVILDADGNELKRIPGPERGSNDVYHSPVKETIEKCKTYADPALRAKMEEKEEARNSKEPIAYIRARKEVERHKNSEGLIEWSPGEINKSSVVKTLEKIKCPAIEAKAGEEWLLAAAKIFENPEIKDICIVFVGGGQLEKGFSIPAADAWTQLKKAAGTVCADIYINEDARGIRFARTTAGFRPIFCDCFAEDDKGCPASDDFSLRLINGVWHAGRVQVEAWPGIQVAPLSNEPLIKRMRNVKSPFPRRPAQNADEAHPRKRYLTVEEFFDKVKTVFPDVYFLEGRHQFEPWCPYGNYANLYSVLWWKYGENSLYCMGDVLCIYWMYSANLTPRKWKAKDGSVLFGRPIGISEDGGTLLFQRKSGSGITPVLSKNLSENDYNTVFGHWEYQFFPEKYIPPKDKNTGGDDRVFAEWLPRYRKEGKEWKYIDSLPAGSQRSTAAGKESDKKSAGETRRGSSGNAAGGNPKKEKTRKAKSPVFKTVEFSGPPDDWDKGTFNISGREIGFTIPGDAIPEVKEGRRVKIVSLDFGYTPDCYDSTHAAKIAISSVDAANKEWTSHAVVTNMQRTIKSKDGGAVSRLEYSFGAFSEMPVLEIGKRYIVTFKDGADVKMERVRYAVGTMQNGKPIFDGLDFQGGNGRTYYPIYSLKVLVRDRESEK